MSNARQLAWDAAGAAASALVRDRQRVGLGTGRAAAAGIRSLAARVAEGLTVVGVPTSRASAELARGLGVRLGRLTDDLDLAFDGADAVDPSGLLVKGAGGAHVRERVVAVASQRFVVLVDEPKLVSSLDAWGVLPIACLPFARERLLLELASLSPAPRPARSDDGLVLIDLHPPAGADWRALAAGLRSRPGVVDHGLFDVAPSDVFVGAVDGSCRTLAGGPAK